MTATAAMLGVSGCAQQRQVARTDPPSQQQVVRGNIPDQSHRSREFEPIKTPPPSTAEPSTVGETPATYTKPAAQQAETHGAVTVRSLVDNAAKYYNGLESCTYRVTRQERVGKRLMTPELIEVHYRKEPRSVFYRWLNPENQGRECVFVKGKHDGKVVTMGGKGDFLLTGRRIAVDPDGILARSKSRYTIHESGLDFVVNRFQQVLNMIDQGNQTGGTVIYKGIVEHPDLGGEKVHHVRHVFGAGLEPTFPKGGTRDWYFDVQSPRVRAIKAVDPQGQLLEHYKFERLMENPTLSDEDFDPDMLWPQTVKKKKRKST